MVKIELATSDNHIQQMVELQSKNLKRNVAPENRESQGFVTAEHTFAELKHINDDEQASIATYEGNVVGYAIAMTRESGEIMPIFKDLYDVVDTITFENKSLNDFKYIFVGQLCVAKEFAGQGIAQRLYAHFKEHFTGKYDFVITDISSLNPRSLKAHEKSGFQKIHSFYDTFSDSIWDIVLMDCR